MIIDLTGKHAVVTGSSGGIGFECARGLARAGANVTVNGRSQATVEKALGRLREEFPGQEFTGAIADLHARDGTDAIIAAAPSCDILISNAAVNVIESVLTQPDEVYLDLFEMNFLSGVRLARHYMPGMIARNWGRMIFHSSEQALRPSPDMAAYAATKAALLTTARSIAEYTKGTGVTVNTVIIGPTKSDVTTALHDDIASSSGQTLEEVEKDFFTHVRPASLLQRFARGEEVANMAVYLASDYASATNGTVCSVEGGTREVIF
ncbi:MAG: SDR family NAD(P)-dependent oxidoreductase [Candidatus Andeanibacterium colombiense]|uniref:SDR family NAD(P)-dependent oxidoreductase n=1 Tax=Candidatus Andeanibacterium colombiense TaxID=3121345 RepID=A0AAJ5X6D6_9SPHN|nr:MAG: SDR family NAD(P)-dependent oxidoreductase [Sphingomonadaceae bacterium]